MPVHISLYFVFAFECLNDLCIGVCLFFSLPMSTKTDVYTMFFSLKGRESKLFKCGSAQINRLHPELSLPQLKRCTFQLCSLHDVQTRLCSVLNTTHVSSFKYSVRGAMLQCWLFLLNMIKDWNNEVNLYNPCEPKDYTWHCPLFLCNGLTAAQHLHHKTTVVMVICTV